MLAASLKNVHRHDDRLLLPGSGWEFYKWNREDVVGFLLACLAVVGVQVLMTVLIGLGA